MRPEPRKHALFSPKISDRESVTFLAGLVAIVGSFGPWFHATRTVTPPMGDPTTTAVTMLGHAFTGIPVAVFVAIAVAAILTPLRPTVKAWTRISLFTLAFAGAAVAAFLGPQGWGLNIFVDFTDVRLGWGLITVLIATAIAALSVASRFVRPNGLFVSSAE